jgi:hypothetical protein
MRSLILVLALFAGAARAQTPADPDDDEPVPVEPPPVIYVPLPPPPVVKPVARRPSTRFVFHLDLVGSYRYALKESFGGAALHAFVGGEKEAMRFGAIADIEMGASRLGLFYSVVDFGFEFAGRLGDRLHLGVAPHLGVMIIQRRTEDDPADDLAGFLFGVAGTMSIDVARFKRSTLQLIGRIGYDFIDTGGNYSYASGMVAQLGVGIQL